MTQSLDIAVVGATGTVGETLVQILEERDFPVANLHLLASVESAGHSVPFRGKNVRVREVDEFDFSKVQLVFFAAGPAITRSYATRATAAGCTVIDLSGGLAVEQAPNVVPEINVALLAGLKKPYQVSSPSPCATALAVAMAPLRGLLDVLRVNVTACLAVSSQGREGVAELARQTAELLNVRPMEPRFFDRQMAFNVLAQVGTPDAQGHVPLEKRLVAELREVLALPLLKISVSCIQVPVFFGDSFSVSLQASGPIDLAAVNAALNMAPGIELVEAGDYPTAVGDAVGQDVVYIGRVRLGVDDPAELNLWITSDNVRKGAALNAVQVAELLIKDLV
ncbi:MULTISPECIES: aspartate-semialdehyde dehydrogenase [unclassified Pseudomonas]|uniref:aspartate-semialdehyde dehydrogenase n=1 Tax=unclassified Pseudomonas TaxID=196821 RepID=UPI002AC9C11A|nr:MULTISPECIES: aspartate-semialdehyde dehydrogenase [unclassified Pseudomonas]MEB0041882.1 aspartate-semialdehyde dehydrogenase [Pseudomonas sp. MH10]MEB0079476.1 aspartate-semialdehyde dehydrogenase [Pseudomonas sp. MH10out]MEB0093313.1 aspartate-semialdehyde dehydrogenase [Pseudomonas sp. CCI4.2]MEB0102499.1 aspartate-semialdehyde dehydrogenase [Pseudomonas sp. CCI3.2]MEB0122391.1 aspartate-semialdehyde dehydrogenase [Pseudomonas sp. CCI1.2]